MPFSGAIGDEMGEVGNIYCGGVFPIDGEPSTNEIGEKGGGLSTNSSNNRGLILLLGRGVGS